MNAFRSWICRVGLPCIEPFEQLVDSVYSTGLFCEAGRSSSAALTALSQAAEWRWFRRNKRSKRADFASTL